MEYALYRTMADNLNKNGAFKECLGQNVFKHIVLGLNYLHQLKYAYRDLKLENIFVWRNGIPKLADFTLAKKKL